MGEMKKKRARGRHASRMSILLTEYSEPVLVLFLDFSTHKAQLLGFYSQMSIKSVLCTEGKFSVFFRVYAISTFRLFI